MARCEEALPGPNSRHKREHHVPESEAELLVHDCWPRWRRGGEFDRRVEVALGGRGEERLARESERAREMEWRGAHRGRQV